MSSTTCIGTLKNGTSCTNKKKYGDYCGVHKTQNKSTTLTVNEPKLHGYKLLFEKDFYKYYVMIFFPELLKEFCDTVLDKVDKIISLMSHELQELFFLKKMSLDDYYSYFNVTEDKYCGFYEFLYDEIFNIFPYEDDCGPSILKYKNYSINENGEIIIHNDEIEYNRNDILKKVIIFKNIFDDMYVIILKNN